MLRGKKLLLILFYCMCMSVVCVSVVCVSVVCVCAQVYMCLVLRYMWKAEVEVPYLPPLSSDLFIEQGL